MCTTKQMIYSAAFIFKGIEDKLDDSTKQLVNNWVHKYEEMFIEPTPMDDGPIFELDNKLNARLTNLNKIFGSTKGAI